MFAVIGKKIFDKLCSTPDFNEANSPLGSELITNGTFFGTISGWDTSAGYPRGLSLDDNRLKFNTAGVLAAGAYTSIDVESGKSYLCSYDYESVAGVRIDIGQTTFSDDIYVGVDQAGGSGTVTFFFKSNFTGSAYLTINNLTTDASSYGLLDNISLKEFEPKVFPVIIPQGTAYPATIFEIANVDNFITKSSSLASCDVSLRIACFADDYNTTYNQSKAVVEALDYYSVTYTEDGVSYTAKFRFVSLDDDYYKLPEKFYKNLIFNCLITKN